MRALIDSDVIRYRYGFMAQRKDEDGTIIAEPDHSVVGAVKVGIYTILEKTGADSFDLYLSGKSNFRYLVDPEYKANRRDFEKPVHYKTITDYLLYCQDAIMCDGIEADDQLAMEQTDKTIICTIDKDLDQVPGWHYNFVTDNKYYVTPEEAEYNLWEQMLVGDTVDNIKGVPGIGVVRAKKILAQEGNFTLSELVQSKYLEVFGEEWEKEFEKNYNLLYLLRTEEEATVWRSRLREAS